MTVCDLKSLVRLEESDFADLSFDCDEVPLYKLISEWYAEAVDETDARHVCPRQLRLAVVRFSRWAMSYYGVDDIDAVIACCGICVTRRWADISGYAGFGISPANIRD